MSVDGPEDWLALLHGAADAVVAALADVTDWGPSGLREGQYAPDIVADEAALAVLHGAGIRVLSEESGLDDGDGPVAVIDPLDGSTNASLRLPWFATSLCVVDDVGPAAAVVHDLAGGDRFAAVRGGGATRNGESLRSRPEVPLASRPAVPLGDAIVAANGPVPQGAGWAQFRCMGATALDLCAVADGRFAGYIDFDGGLGVWDYLGAMLICAEVGIDMVDAHGRDLVVLDHTARRSPIAGPPELLGDLTAIRRRG